MKSIAKSLAEACRIRPSRVRSLHFISQAVGIRTDDVRERGESLPEYLGAVVHAENKHILELHRPLLLLDHHVTHPGVAQRSPERVRVLGGRRRSPSDALRAWSEGVSVGKAWTERCAKDSDDNGEGREEGEDLGDDEEREAPGVHCLRELDRRDGEAQQSEREKRVRWKDRTSQRRGESGVTLVAKRSVEHSR